MASEKDPEVPDGEAGSRFGHRGTYGSATVQAGGLGQEASPSCTHQVRNTPPILGLMTKWDNAKKGLDRAWGG